LKAAISSILIIKPSSLGDIVHTLPAAALIRDDAGRYLITQKKLDPMRVLPVSYGESNPTTDNSSPQGRAKNRRVEILVYREGITSQPAMASAPESAPAQQQQQQSPTSSQVQPSNRLTQR